MNELIGIDEVGRGCWAGPLLVVAARAVTKLPAGLADSKLLSRKQRENLYPQIVASCSLGEGWVAPDEIDNLGLSAAMQLAVARALEQLGAESESPIIMDGNINYCSAQFSKVRCEVKADASFPIVSAASIYAKVLRDRYMVEANQTYPGYGFERHAGYGTQAHLLAMQQLGLCGLHRLSYKPVKALL